MTYLESQCVPHRKCQPDSSEGEKLISQGTHRDQMREVDVKVLYLAVLHLCPAAQCHNSEGRYHRGRKETYCGVQLMTRWPTLRSFEEASTCEASVSAPVVEVKSVLSVESRELLISCTVMEVSLLTVLTTTPSAGMGDWIPGMHSRYLLLFT